MIFLAMLRVQWRWCRGILLSGAAVAGLLPFLSLRGITASLMPAEAMAGIRAWSPMYPAVAALLGLLVALASWAADRRGQHVHALTLPIERWRYVLLRFTGGALLLALPIVILAVAAWWATASAALPAGLSPYPWSLAFRFAVGTLLAFALFFAILSGTPRTAAIVLGILVGVVLLDLVLGVVLPRVGLGNDLLTALFVGPGPFALFAGRWMLVDV